MQTKDSIFGLKFIYPLCYSNLKFSLPACAMSLPEQDEWELINDDGFVYKRKKRPRLDITATSSAPPPDPLVEDKNRKIRRRNALLKLKDRYQAELFRWELLSNTLRDLNLQTQNVENRFEKIDMGPRGDELSVEFSGFSRCGLVDDLLAQVVSRSELFAKFTSFFLNARNLFVVYGVFVFLFLVISSFGLFVKLMFS